MLITITSGSMFSGKTTIFLYLLSCICDGEDFSLEDINDISYDELVKNFLEGREKHYKKYIDSTLRHIAFHFDRHFEKEEVFLGKPSLDNRYEGISISTHDNLVNNVDVTLIPQEDYQFSEDYNLFAISECFMLTEKQTDDLINLSKKGKIVILEGLRLSSEGKSFPVMDKFLANSDIVLNLKGTKCVDCNQKDSNLMFCTVDKTDRIKVGNFYIPLCWECWYKRQ